MINERDFFTEKWLNETQSSAEPIRKLAVVHSVFARSSQGIQCSNVISDVYDSALAMMTKKRENTPPQSNILKKTVFGE